MSSVPQPLEAMSASYRSAAPHILSLRLSEIEDFLPRKLLLREIAENETVDFPAAHILAHIVPTLSLKLLAELRPDLIEPARGLVRLPAQRVAKAYQLWETKDSTPLEPDEFLIRDEISSPSTHLGKILASANESHAEVDEVTMEPFEGPTEPELEPAPRRLAEIIGNLPTFQRVTETTFLTLKPLATEPPQTFATAQSDPPDQHALQALFMTDENLSTDRVVELCGGLPGIQSCVLTSKNQVVASHNIPEGLDIVSLTSNATSMLRAMHAASAGMGIGEIPAVTFYTARGPLSILQKEHLSMLVFHGERGFVPGVREKMTAALTALTPTPLALPSPTPEG
jgi:hypothetical protein